MYGLVNIWCIMQVITYVGKIFMQKYYNEVIWNIYFVYT